MITGSAAQNALLSFGKVLVTGRIIAKVNRVSVLGGHYSGH